MPEPTELLLIVPASVLVAAAGALAYRWKKNAAVRSRAQDPNQ